MGISMVKQRAVFLDRDGVLVRVVVRGGKPYPPASVKEMEIFPEAAGVLERLKRRGYLLVVVTNQPDVARGTQSRSVVDAMHERLKRVLLLDDILVCCHDDSDFCDCRKPLFGLLLAAARWHDIDLANSFMIGDRWRDIEAGRHAGCRTVFIDYGYDEQKSSPPGDIRVTSLQEAADWILGQVPSVTELKIKIFADGADKAAMLDLYRNPLVRGFTTNPTLMRKAGVRDYVSFAKDILRAIPDRPISFEVFADDFPEMERQAKEIAAWGPNVYVKIPVTNTRRESSCDLARKLSRQGVKLNVTAILTVEQVRDVCAALTGGVPSYVSVFAGRIADTGRDPVPLMAEAVEMVNGVPGCELIWASPRELLNIFHAESVGCHIITVTSDVLKKLDLIGKDLTEYSLETVKMFHDDAKAGQEFL
jgi:transaldolase